MIGLDGTQAMLLQSKSKIDKQRINNVELIQADALNIPFSNETFDDVISLNFIHLFVPYSIKKQMEFISEMSRICKKGGNIIVEFDNALFLKKLGNRFSDIYKTNKQLKFEKIIGTYIPKMLYVYKLNECIANTYALLSEFPVIKRFAFKWIVKYHKRL